jgi:signal transduction histidine kinase
MVKKIFLPFFTTKDRGVGLGLALVHKVITTHGGRIEVESAEGKGTVFTIILPRGQVS